MSGDDRHVFDFDPDSGRNQARPDASSRHAQGAPTGELPRIVSQARQKVSKPKSRLRRSASLTVKLVLLLLVMGGAGLATLYWQVSRAPLSVAFLVKPIEDAINRELQGYTVKIADTVLQRKPGSRAVAFRMSQLSLYDPAGDKIAEAPLASMRLSMPALALGRIAPSRIHLIRPQIRLSYAPDEGLALAVQRARETATPATATAEDERRSNGETLRISLMRTISSAFKDARQRRHSTSYLKAIGIKDALVIFDSDAGQTFWEMPIFTVGLSHGRNQSVISGSGKFASATGPWSFDFRVDESDKRQNLKLSVEVRDLIPTGIAVNFPQFAALRSFPLPLTAQSRIDIASDGRLLGADVQVNVAAGLLKIPGMDTAALNLNEGLLKLRYDHDSHSVRLLPSKIAWGGSKITLTGDASQTDDTDRWRFSMTGSDGTLAAPTSDARPASIDKLDITGSVSLAEKSLTFDRLVFAAVGAEIAGRATLGAPDSSAPGIKADLTLTSVATDRAKYLWPEMVSPSGRAWFMRNVTGGRITGGRLRVNMTTETISKAFNGGPIPAAGLQMQIDGDGLVIDYLDGAPPVLTGFATARLAGQLFQVDVPLGTLIMPDGAVMKMRKGIFLIQDHRPDHPDSRLTFQLDTDSNGALTLLRQPAFEALEPPAIKATDLVGRLSGLLQLDIPLRKNITLADISVRGQARLRDLAYKKAFGKVKLNGGSIDFGITDKAIDARGDILLNGVAAKVYWQRIFGAESVKQPPLRITADLDNADRAQLGLDLGDIVRGQIPFALTITPSQAGKAQQIAVQANLNNAELTLDNIGWSKERGRAASLQFQIADGPKGTTELRDFKIFGDDISIDGWLSLDSKSRLAAFHFPDFSFNVITHLELTGEVGRDGIWNVKAKGSGYDGREFFRSLFTKTARNVSAPDSAKRAGINLDAQFATLLGFSDTTLRDVTISMQRRKGKLTALKANGSLGVNKPLAVELRYDKGKRRRIVAEAADAGRAFKLVGFYPNVVGGRTALSVDLDVNKLTDTRGTLWAYNFRVLGDPIVNEVLDDTDETGRRRPRNNRNKPRRAVFQFDQLRIPFSVGQGQFVMHRSQINGPLIGASMTGKVDMARDRVNISGTYVPLYGLNAAFGELPILGQILVGRRGEGIFGITFGVSGSLSNPDVKVNPMSLLTPGVFRGLMEFDVPNNRITERNGKPRKRARPRVSGSSDTARQRRPRVTPEIGTSGWTTQTDGN